LAWNDIITFSLLGGAADIHACMFYISVPLKTHTWLPPILIIVLYLFRITSQELIALLRGAAGTLCIFLKGLYINGPIKYLSIFDRSKVIRVICVDIISIVVHQLV